MGRGEKKRGRGWDQRFLNIHMGMVLIGKAGSKRPTSASTESHDAPDAHIRTAPAHSAAACGGRVRSAIPICAGRGQKSVREAEVDRFSMEYVEKSYEHLFDLDIFW